MKYPILDSVHAVATIVVFNSVLDKGLPDSGPQRSLKDCNVHQLVDINSMQFGTGIENVLQTFCLNISLHLLCSGTMFF